MHHFKIPVSSQLLCVICFQPFIGYGGHVRLCVYPAVLFIRLALTQGHAMRAPFALPDSLPKSEHGGLRQSLAFSFGASGKQAAPSFDKESLICSAGVACGRLDFSSFDVRTKKTTFLSRRFCKPLQQIEEKVTPFLPLHLPWNFPS